ncbi:MAG: energy transducer TonB [Acidobacteriota bacterium]|nr:energy transducer TonB [Acidobacteriota bacterium]
MKKFCVVILFIIFNSIFIFAQSEIQKPVEWSNFAPAGEEFSIEVPFALVNRNLLKDDTSRRYSNKVGENYFFIFSDSAKKPFQYKVVSDFINSFQKSAMSELVNNSQAEKFSFGDAEGFYHKILMVKTERRVYVFQTVSPNENDSDVERFFDGIQFHKLPEEKSNALEDKNFPASDQDATDKNSSNNKSAIGAGNGFGQGNGSATSGINQLPAPAVAENQTSPLNILTKPRASYTNLARFYQITGTIQVRINFLANGTIGEVTPITKLPFGLTDEAVAAARSMRFSPAMKVGQPYSVTKIVQYQFDIY